MEKILDWKLRQLMIAIQILLIVLLFVILCCSVAGFGRRQLILSALLGIFSVLCIGALKKVTDTISRLIYTGLIVFLTGVFFLSMCVPNIMWDTWQVYDMSRYAFTDFGYMQMIRQHMVNTHYEMAFPPLFPVLVAILNTVVDLGVMATVVWVYVFAILTVVTLASLGQQLKINRVAALTTAIAVCNTYYIGGIKGGNTQILGWFILTLMAKLVCGMRLTRKVLWKCAILAGLGLMNRFDFLAVGAVTLIVLPLISWYQEKDTAARFATKLIQVWMLFGIVVSPWIIYSRLHFGSWFITDNGRRLRNVVDTRPSTYFPPEAPALTISDDFGQWSIAFLQRIGNSVQGFLNAAQRTCLLPICLISILCVVGMVLLAIKQQQLSFFHSNISVSTFSNIVKNNGGSIYFFFCILGQECTIFLTGYEEPRYHLAFLVTVQAILATAVYRLCGGIKEKAGIKRLYLGLKCLIVLNILFVAALPWRRVMGYFEQEHYGFASQLALDGADQELAQYLHQNDCACLAISRNLEETHLPRFAALSDLTTIMTPSNLDTSNAGYFIRDFDVDYIYADDEGTVHIFEMVQDLEKTPFSGVYKVRK